MIASLPMYDRPETQAANDRLWSLIRAGLGRGPERLTRGTSLWDDWRNPDLLLSQTCGLPYALGLHEVAQLVASPVFALPDCPPGHYFSWIVTRRDDPRREVADFDGARLACNSFDSQSGFGSAQILARKHGIAFSDPLATGAHALSAKALAAGEAEIAMIDAVTWTMIERWDASAAALQIIGRTDPTPATPYITARGNDPAPIAAAMAGAIAALAEADRDLLRLTGVTHVSHDAYLAVPRPEVPE